jgi:hypothetical protein
LTGFGTRTLLLLGFSCMGFRILENLSARCADTTPPTKNSIHPIAWKKNSANFAITEFSEVRRHRILGSCTLIFGG